MSDTIGAQPGSIPVLDGDLEIRVAFTNAITCPPGEPFVSQVESTIAIPVFSPPFREDAGPPGQCPVCIAATRTRFF